LATSVAEGGEGWSVARGLSAVEPATLRGWALATNRLTEPSNSVREEKDKEEEEPEPAT